MIIVIMIIAKNMAENNTSILGGQNGFSCPVCHKFIPVSAKDLFQKVAIKCPSCSLSLTVDRKQSEAAMRMLERVIKGQEEIDNKR